MPKIKCDYCGKEIYKRPNEIIRHKTNSCSRECYFNLISKEHNEYYIKDDIVYLKLISKTFGDTVFIIDLDDLEKVNKYYWIIYKNGNNLYVQNSKKSDGRILLHRYLTNAPKGMVVDHINRDTLDNRKGNLRVVSNSINIINSDTCRNKIIASKNIYFHPKLNKYRVGFTRNKKAFTVGFFETIDKAIESRNNYLKTEGLVYNVENLERVS